MDDLLKQCAHAYKELAVFKYHFLLGKKGSSYHLTIEFPEESFWHLAGLHKLRMEIFKNRKKALQIILDGSIGNYSIDDSQIISRWTSICHLKELIESNRVVFKYKSHEFKGSVIKAEYLMVDEKTMFFVREGYPVSIFCPSDDQRLQARKCPSLITLRILREEVSSGIINELYVSPSYKENTVN